MELARKPIDFLKIAKETEVRKGKIAFSDTFNSWVVIGHPEINMICIDPPMKIGETILNHKIQHVTIENNNWVFHSAKQ